jgi:ATP/maltotriose-dependent transcriptional regulator MalT
VVTGELAVSLARDQDQVLALQSAHAVASYVHAGRGDLAIAEEHVEAAAALVELVPSWGGTSALMLARALLAQARDDAPALRRVVELPVDDAVGADLETRYKWPWRVLVAEACLGAGDIDGARRAVDGLDHLVARRHLRSPTADVARLRGLLMEAAGEQQAARAAYEAGLAAATLPLPTARLQLAYARWLRQNGAKRAAIEQLRQVRHGLAGLGARVFLTRCDEELSACGVAPKRGRVDALGLTATELSVTHLVAQGLSNREAAARLYVSAKAVEYHLGHIYAKLGITSRRQLAALLTERAAS